MAILKEFGMHENITLYIIIRCQNKSMFCYFSKCFNIISVHFGFGSVGLQESRVPLLFSFVSLF